MAYHIPGTVITTVSSFLLGSFESGPERPFQVSIWMLSFWMCEGAAVPADVSAVWGLDKPLSCGHGSENCPHLERMGNSSGMQSVTNAPEYSQSRISTGNLEKPNVV